jgi:ESS family glutamate:Na+ symporter
MVLARRMLPREHWFELGLINYGMSTGTTATGFVLLRLIDPELESGAAEDYALAAPLSSPFIGGGMITVALPLLVLERLPLAATALGLCLVVAVLIMIGQRWNTSAERTEPLGKSEHTK